MVDGRYRKVLTLSPLSKNWYSRRDSNSQLPSCKGGTLTNWVTRVFGCGGGTRTHDLQIMTLTSYQLLHTAINMPIEKFATFSERLSKSILRLRLSDGNAHVVSINDFHLSESKTGNFFLLPKPDYTLHSQLTLTQHRSLLHYCTTETKLTAITLAERVRYMFYRDILKTLGSRWKTRTLITGVRNQRPNQLDETELLGV